MSGTKLGGRKAAKTNKEKYGDNFYSKIGRKGGAKSHPETRPFAKNPALASEAGRKGGRNSSRAGIKNKKPRVVAKAEPDEQKNDKIRKGILGWFSGRKSK